jgi:hypothetical protein
VARAWGEQAHACFESPSSTAPCAGGCHTRLHRPLLGHQPVRQQNNTKGSRTPAPRAPMGSPPAEDTRPGVLQQTHAVRGAGAALPRCPGPRSADLKRAPSNFSKSGRYGRRGAAAQHTHYGAVHRVGAAACDARLVSAARGVQRAQQGAARALSPILSPILGKASSREFSAQKYIGVLSKPHNNHTK